MGRRTRGALVVLALGLAVGGGAGCGSGDSAEVTTTPASLDRCQPVSAARLREIRKQSNLSQEKLAAEAGLDRTYVSGCERGVRNISLANIVKLAAALGVQPSELLDNQ